MKYIDLFAGIGGFRTAFDKAGFDCLFSSEKDKYASKAYEVLYEDTPDGDITQIDAENIPEHAILTGGFPCQAYSIAGQRQGMQFECIDCGHKHVVTFNEYKDVITCPFCGSGGTKAKDDRGLLFFEIARIASEKKPKVLLLENVKGLLSHNKGKTIELILETLSEIGYTIDFTILNSKYYDVPQQRERVFIVGVLDWVTEPYKINGNNVLAKTKKRVNELGIKTFNFDWPDNNEVTTKLADILEENPDEKYYLSDEKTKKLLERLEEDEMKELFLIDDQGRKEKNLKPLSICPTLRRETHGNLPKVVGLLDMKGNESTRRIDAPNGLSPTLTTMGGGHREPKIAVEFSRKSGIGKEIKEAFTLNSSDYRGLNRNQKQTAILEVRPVLTPERVEKRQNGRRFKNDGEESFTLTAIDRHGVAIGKYPKYRIRKLTPLECFRLQGFPDEYYYKLKRANISNTQLYKMAGNAVTVNVVYEIAKKIKELF